MITYVLGNVLKIESICLLFPVVCSLIYREQEGVPFLLTSIVSFGLGFLAAHERPSETAFSLRDGYVTTALSWLILSVVGAIPFIVTGEIPDVIDALFETVSGFTTTGASISNDVESFSHAALLWRSFTHWIGGMGVLVFLLAIIPMTGGGSLNIMKAESPGPSVGKLVPKMKQTAGILYKIYIALTVLEFILLVIFKMPIFDSICTALGTAGTGGFGIKNDSMASYSLPLQWIVIVFMLLFGVNFNAYFFIIRKQVKKALGITEVKAYLLIVFASVAIITVNTLKSAASLIDAVTASAFQVSSIITTTGFSTADFDAWPSLSKGILVTLMFIGACAGSTGGGIKVSRILILLKTIKNEMISMVHPKSIRKITLDGKSIDETTLHGVYTYMSAYIPILVLSSLVLYAYGSDMVSGFTAVTATLNNIGPGLADVGPSKSFSDLAALPKLVLIFDMLAGRLELYPMMVVIAPWTWRK